MKDIVCPICGKNGIPDYYSQDVVCPCCGSDLSIYRLVDQIESGAKLQQKDGPKFAKYSVYTFASLAAVLLLVFCFLIIRVSHNSKRLESSEDRCAALLAENEMLKASVSQQEAMTVQTKVTSAFKYIVREGDSFWSISKKLYGTGTRYKEIAEANNLDINTVLNVGDQLVIE